MSHHCHATDCETVVPPAMFLCKRHWLGLPKHLRDAIRKTYRSGQCDDWNITHDYANAARSAVIYIAEKERKLPDVSIYNMLDPAPETTR